VSAFIVHSVPGSPFGRAVLIALEEKGARYRFVPVAPGKNANLIAWLHRMSARPSLEATTWERVSAMALAS
jgi:glutathione S-transferase